jgi:hypothetical protein
MVAIDANGLSPIKSSQGAENPNTNPRNTVSITQLAITIFFNELFLSFNISTNIRFLLDQSSI